MDLINLTKSDTFDPEEEFIMKFHPMEVLNTITSIVSALANIFIIYIVLKYTIMRTRPNVYLANWCISNCIVMLVMPVSLNLFGLNEKVSFELLCLWEQSFYAMLFGNLLFVVILLLDWYIVTYTQQNCSTNCKQIHLFVIAVSWIVILSISIASLTFCLLDWSYPLSVVCFILGYLFAFIVIIVIIFLRSIKVYILKQTKEKSKLELIIVTSYFVCWLANWISMYAQMFWRTVYFSPTYEYVTYFLGLSHGWVMLILLYFFDKSFNVCIRKVFGAKVYAVEDARLSKEQNTVLL